MSTVGLVNRESLENKFESSGERDRLKELLTQRLKESGWHNQVANLTSNLESRLQTEQIGK